MPHVENPALDANVIKIRARGYENNKRKAQHNEKQRLLCSFIALKYIRIMIQCMTKPADKTSALSIVHFRDNYDILYVKLIYVLVCTSRFRLRSGRTGTIFFVMCASKSGGDISPRRNFLKIITTLEKFVL